MQSDICAVWQPENPENDQLYYCSSAQPEFLIELYASIDGRVYCRKFKAQCHILTDRMTSWYVISDMLCQAGVPYHVQPLMIQKITTDAQQIANDPSNMYLKTIPMMVSLRVPEDLEEFPEFSEWPEFPAHEIRFVPASKSAIEDLLDTRVKNEEQCMVCLDEIPAEGKAKCMPCSHMFHQSCIENWLEQSNLCPLCRFQMSARYV